MGISIALLLNISLIKHNIHTQSKIIILDLVNVIVRISPAEKNGGKTERSAVMINAHFDSVPQGPGAGDDGAK